MSAPTATVRRLPGLPGSRRLVGVDATRGLALLGMMAAHLLQRQSAAGDPSWAFELVAGRSSAAFAVLAGVGLALVDGGHRGSPAPWRLMASRVAVRAGAILLIGLLLATSQPPVAVILQYYALSFLLLAPLLRLPAWVLAGTGFVWLATAPLLSHALRAAFQLTGPGPQVGLEQVLTRPADALVELVLTGYYPVLTWFGYLLLGAGVGRLDLSRRAVAAGLALTGAGLVAATGLVSDLLLGAGGRSAIEAVGDPVTQRSPDGPFFGTTPTSTWWWLAVDEPHSGSPFDLLGTAGAALLVLGVLLLLARTPPGWFLVPAAAAGSMTLTLYTGHVLAVLLGLPGLGGPVDWWVHAMSALVLATLWRLRFARGPLESATATVVDAVAGPVSRR